MQANVSARQGAFFSVFPDALLHAGGIPAWDKNVLPQNISGLPEVFGPDSIENNAMSRWGAASRARGHWGGAHNLR
jgi:hypothetical protein